MRASDVEKFALGFIIVCFGLAVAAFGLGIWAVIELVLWVASK